MYRKRFGLTGHPLPKNAQGKTFFEDTPGYERLKRDFEHLILEPGLGTIGADAGMGKTAAMRNLCAQLPKPDYLVLYNCDTAVAPLDLYRTIATAIGVQPSHRRAQLWTDIKKALVHMVDERGSSPTIVLDEAQHLSDSFLVDLSGFLNFAFDSRDLITLWLVGLPALSRHLRMQIHAPLAMRVVYQVHLEPLDRKLFAAMIDHGLEAVGATQNVLADPARELLFRASRGVPRLASNLLRRALREAHQRNQSFIDENTMETAIDTSPAVQAVTG